MPRFPDAAKSFDAGSLDAEIVCQGGSFFIVQETGRNRRSGFAMERIEAFSVQAARMEATAFPATQYEAQRGGCGLQKAW